MECFITTTIVGIILCVLGCVNMTGNISSLHWYHRQRVTEENRKPFGKLVGLGTLTIGVAIILFGILPTHVPFTADCMKSESIVLLEQIRTIDKSRLDEYIGKIDKKTMGAVDKALITSFGIKYMEVLL